MILDLSNNHLTALPNALAHLVCLVSLDLSHNPLAFSAQKIVETTDTPEPPTESANDSENTDGATPVKSGQIDSLEPLRALTVKRAHWHWFTVWQALTSLALTKCELGVDDSVMFFLKCDNFEKFEHCRPILMAIRTGVVCYYHWLT